MKGTREASYFDVNYYTIMSIFGTAAQSSLGSTSGNRHALEFKAGRMTLEDNVEQGVKKKMVVPDQR